MGKSQKEHTIEAVDRYLNAYQNGQFRSQARALKKELENNLQFELHTAEAESVWASVNKRSVESLGDFVRNYPESGHVKEANTLINALLLDEIMDISADTLVEQIKKFQTSNQLTVEQKDNNIIAEITDYITNKKITKQDFLDKLSEDHNLLSAGIVKRLVESGIIALNDLLSIKIEKPLFKRC